MRLWAIIALLLCATTAAEAKNYVFGNSGRDGFNGRSGLHGRDGRAVNVFADGRSQSFDVSGSNGEAGEWGDGGDNATACYQRCGRENETGANGGNGGYGGDGGRGGTAGNVTVYYSALADVGNISVDARAGSGGRGGYGGRGGSACRCQERQWVIDEQTFYCTDGQSGRSAQDGSRGRNGSDSVVTLINSDSVLPAEQDSVSLPLNRLLESNVPLSEHIWDRQSNPTQYFASGSHLPNYFFMYLETFHTSLTTTWDNARPADQFSDLRMNLAVNDRQFSFESPETVWLETELDASNPNDVQLSIQKAVYTSEVSAIEFNGFTGVSRDLQAFVTDNSGVSDLLSTRIYVRYYTRGLIFNRLRWEGWLDEDLVTFNSDNQWMIDLGRIPIDSKWMSDGRKIYVEFVLRRSSGSHEMDIGIQRNHRVGG